MIAAISAVSRPSAGTASNATTGQEFAWVKGLPDLNRQTRRQVGQSGAGWTFTTICSLLHHIRRVGRPAAKKAASVDQRLGVGLAAIADEAGHSENKVRRDLRRLEELGLITVMRPNVTMVRDAAGRLVENRTGRSKAVRVYLTICQEHVRAKASQPIAARMAPSNPARMEGLPMPDSVHSGGAIQRDFNTKRTPAGDADGIGTPAASADAGLPAGEAGGHSAAGTGQEKVTPILPMDAGRDEPPPLPPGRLAPAGKAPARRQTAGKSFASQEQPARSAAEAAAAWHRRNPDQERQRAEYLAAKVAKASPQASSRPPEPQPPAPEPSAPFDLEAARKAALASLKKAVTV
jgi:predicted transcriptional regulator